MAYLTFLHGELLLGIFEIEKIAVSSDLDSPWRSSDAEHFIREQKNVLKSRNIFNEFTHYVLMITAELTPCIKHHDLVF